MTAAAVARVATDAGGGRLAANVMHFARVLRAAGLPLGSDRIVLALQALQVAGLEHRADLHATLAACFVDRAAQRPLFDQAFALFWRDPDLLGRAMAMLLPKVQAQAAPHASAPPENRRLGEALFAPAASTTAPPRERLEIDAELTFSDRERLQQADFDTMSANEWRAAQRALRTLRLVAEPLPTRRSERAARPGRADWRATLARQARRGGDVAELCWRAPRLRPAPVVVLADISGSMSRYSRMLLQFAHTLARANAGRVETFVFGTRLTRITHAMRERDPDAALTLALREVADWSGGTRITACLREFNHRWARRVLGGRSTVILVSDGLEHGDTAALGFEAERLRKSCRRLWWLNPLLRFDGFEPRAAGIRALLPQVDRLLPAHNLASLEALARRLAQPQEARPCN